MTERAGAERSADVLGGVQHHAVVAGLFAGGAFGQAAEHVELDALHAEFVMEQALAVVGDDYVDLVPEADERGAELLGVRRARGAGDADDHPAPTLRLPALALRMAVQTRAHANLL